MNSNTGELRVNTSLARYLHGFFDVAVQVENPRIGTERLLSSSASVRVYVLTDAHRLKLIFNHRADDVRDNMAAFIADINDNVASNLDIQV